MQKHSVLISIIGLFLISSVPAWAVPLLPLQFTPAAVQFGVVTIGDSLDSTTSVILRLRDPGTSFGPIRIQLSDPNHFALLSDTCSGATLSGNMDCQIASSFSPDLFGHYSSFLVILDETGNLGNFIPLEGIGAESGFPGPPGPVAGETSVSVSTTLLDFGLEAIGVLSEGKGVTLINTGNTDLRVQATTFGGDAPFNFARIDACAPQLVSPGGTCAVTAFFTPISGDPVQAAMAISANVPDSPLVISLAGNGAAPGPIPSGGGCSLGSSASSSGAFGSLFLVYSLLVLANIRRLQ